MKRREAGLPFRSLALVAATIALTTTMAPAQTEFKRFNIIVGFGAGGGYDLYARLLARHMSQFLPGQPKIIVQNMLGGGSLKTVEYLDTGALQDGTVIVEFSPGMIIESLVNPEKIQFEFSNVAWIGSITRDLRACYAWGATGIKTMTDLKKAKQFNMGAPAPGSSNFLNAAVLKNMFGIAVHHVNGYPTSSAQRLAIERGELDGDCGAWSSVPEDWLHDHKINPIVSFSSAPVPGFFSRKVRFQMRFSSTCWYNVVASYADNETPSVVIEGRGDDLGVSISAGPDKGSLVELQLPLGRTEGCDARAMVQALAATPDWLTQGPLV